MDIATTIAATYESFKGAKDIMNSVLDLKVDSEVRIEINKAQHQLGDALASLFELREKLFELQQENHQLKSDAAVDSLWEEKRSQFELVTSPGRAIVYQFRGVPVHYACPSCMDGKKEIHRLQPTKTLSGKSFCPGCKEDYPVEPRIPPPTKRAIGSGYMGA